MWRKKSHWQKRDEAISKAFESLHVAIGELRKAHGHAYEMGDEAFSEALWGLSDRIPKISGPLYDHCYSTNFRNYEQLPYRQLHPQVAKEYFKDWQ